jgi:hypothetical protein
MTLRLVHPDHFALADFVALRSLQKSDNWSGTSAWDDSTSCGWLVMDNIIDEIRATSMIDQDQDLDFKDVVHGSFLILGTHLDVHNRSDPFYGFERYTRETLVTCLGLFVTPVGKTNKHVFERYGAGQIV